MCALYLTDAHVDAPIVLADVEVEVLVVDLHVTPLRQIALESNKRCPWFVQKGVAVNLPAIVCAELLQQIGQCVPELDHSLRRNGDLRTWTAAGDRLRHLHERKG